MAALPDLGALSRRTLLRPSRRSVLLGAAGLGSAALGASLAACGGGESSVPEASSRRALLAAFPQSVPHVPVGVPMRLPYMISDTEGVPLAEMAGPTSFRIFFAGELVAESEVAPRSEGIPRAYLPLEVELAEPGIYDVVATYEGEELDSQLEVFPPEDVAQPVVGEQLPPTPTPTTATPLQVDPICTRVPACEFHGTSLDTVVGKGTRVVVLVATPAYCQTAVCGPTLDNLIDIVGDRDDLVVIHAEVYRNPKSADDLFDAPLAPLPEEYGLTFEPSLFVTDVDGRITARADVVIDRSEMEELLA